MGPTAAHTIKASLPSFQPYEFFLVLGNQLLQSMMEVQPSIGESTSAKYEGAKKLVEFHKTKAGLKCLVDSGLGKIPRIFIHQRMTTTSFAVPHIDNHLEIPLIDLLDLGRGHRKELIDKIRRASEDWGFFLVLPRLIPESVMNEVLECQKQFHEQSTEIKKTIYSLDEQRSVRFYSGGVLFDDSEPADWRDSLEINFTDGRIDTNAIPVICRKAILEYLRSLARLKETLSDLLSEALGLSKDYLSKIEYLKSGKMVCDYYPACPEPHLTLGVSSHSDPHFLTIILQDYSGGLQVLYQKQWVNIPPIRGALAVSIGDLLQLISNDKFKSVEYRVLAKSVGPCLSVTCFFDQSSKSASEPLGPIKELLSVSNPPMYPEILTADLKALFRSKGMDGTSSLSHFRLDQKGWMAPLALSF